MCHSHEQRDPKLPKVQVGGKEECHTLYSLRLPQALPLRGLRALKKRENVLDRPSLEPSLLLTFYFV